LLCRLSISIDSFLKGEGKEEEERKRKEKTIFSENNYTATHAGIVRKQLLFSAFLRIWGALGEVQKFVQCYWKRL